MTLPVAWQPGEHVTVIGDTGTGKTYLTARLVTRRQYVVVFKTKADRTSFPADFARTKTARKLTDPRYKKIIVEPEYRYQSREGWRLFETVWLQGGWTVVIDELWYAEKLGLKDQIERLLTQARSKDISVVVGMQRPVVQTRFAVSQSTHVMTFILEGRDIKTIGEVASPRIEPVIAGLRGHDFAYFNRRTRDVAVGNANRLDEIFGPKSIDKAAARADAGRQTVPA